MSLLELPVITTATGPVGDHAPRRDESWLRDARRARALSWISLGWMTVEGVVGLIAGVDASALSVIVWAASSFVEGLASMIVIWRFTSARSMSEHSERTAQRLVAGSFLLLVPFFVYEAIRRLIDGSDTTSSVLGIIVTASAIVLMPALARAKLRLGQRLGSGATAGEGVQNLLCAAQATAALIALVGASAGLSVIDPIAALLAAAIATRESIKLWHGEANDCCAPSGFYSRTGGACDSRCAAKGALPSHHARPGDTTSLRRLDARRSRAVAGSMLDSDR